MKLEFLKGKILPLTKNKKAPLGIEPMMFIYEYPENATFADLTDTTFGFYVKF